MKKAHQIIKALSSVNGHMLIATFSLLLIVPLVFMALLARPIADDYTYFANDHISSPIKFAVDSYSSQTGRYGQAAFVSGLFRVFGEDSVKYGALIQLFVLLLVGTACIYLLMRSRRGKKAYAIIGLGLLGSLVALTATPSLFDSYLWLTSSTVYLASLIGLVATLCFALILYKKRRPPVWLYALFVIFVIVGQSFSEPTSVLLIASAFIAIFVTKYAYRNSRATLLSLLAFLASITGLLIVYLSPGSRNRQHVSGSGFNFHNMFISSIHDLTHMLYLFTSWRLLLIIILSIGIASILPKMTKKNYIYTLSLSLLGVTLSPYILFVITRYSMAGYIPLRSYTVPAAFTVISLALFVGTLLSLTAKRFANLNNLSSAYIGLLFLLLPFSIITIYPLYAHLLQAEAQRASLYDVRAYDIRQQLNSKITPISVAPAPILITDTEAIDFYYNGPQITWFENGFKKYYGIPQDSKLSYLSQPYAYCTNYSNPTWFGSLSCQEQTTNINQGSRN